MLKDVPRLKAIDFSPLLEHPEDWAEQTEISDDHVRMMDACFVHYGGDVGLVLRYLGGEYTAEWRNGREVAAAAEPFVSKEDLGHIERIIDHGCPAEFSWEEPAWNKEAYLRQGNCPTVQQHWPKVLKTIVKEARNRHLMSFSSWTVRASPYAHAVPQTINNKNPEKPRLCWNGTGRRFPWQIPMNEVTSREREAEITFGYIYMIFLI